MTNNSATLSTRSTQNSSIPQSENNNYDDYAVYFSTKEDVPPIILAFLILLSNGMVFVLVLRNKKLRTITNTLLSSLALSDLLTGLVSIPLYVTCQIFRQSELCIAEDQMLRFVSVSTVCRLTAVSMDRYLAIIYSLRYKAIVTYSRCRYVIMAIWLLSAVMALAQLSWIDPVHHDLFMNPPPDVIRKEVIYDVFSIVVFFVIPLLCMTFIYGKITSAILRQSDSIRRQSTPANQETREAKNRERKAVAIFALMLFVYIVCWLPFFVLRMSNPSELHPLVVYITTWLRFLTSFLNPCLYILGKKDFREALHRKPRRNETELILLVKIRRKSH